MKRLLFPINTKYPEIIESLELTESDKMLVNTSWFDYFTFLDKSAMKDSLFFNILQVTVIFCGILIPVIDQSKYFQSLESDILSVAGILGLIVALATGVSRHFRFEERWKHYRRSAELLRNEGEDYFGLTGNYQEFEAHADALKTFIGVVTTYKRQEVDSFMTKVRKKEENG